MVLEIVWLGSCFVSDGAEGLAQLADEHVVEKRGRDPVLLQKAVQGPHFSRTHGQAAAKASQVLATSPIFFCFLFVKTH